MTEIPTETKPEEVSACLNYLLPDNLKLEDIRMVSPAFADGLLRLIAIELVQQKKKSPWRDPAMAAASALAEIFYRHIKGLGF
jgi:hypothetical protein